MALPEAAENLRLLFLKPVCPGCGVGVRPDEILCRWCSMRLEPCRVPRWSADGSRVGPGERLSAAEPDDPRGVQVHSAFLYSGLPREMVLRLKFGGCRFLAGPAAELLRRYCIFLPAEGDIVAPIPSSPRKRRERGYCQARLISRALAQTLGVRHMDLLEREDGPSQVGLPVEARRRNVQGAFRLRRGLRRKPVSASGIFLVDDVATTCSTMHSAAEVLKGALGGTVSGLTLTYRGRMEGSIVPMIGVSTGRT